MFWAVNSGICCSKLRPMSQRATCWEVHSVMLQLCHWYCFGTWASSRIWVTTAERRTGQWEKMQNHRNIFHCVHLLQNASSQRSLTFNEFGWSQQHIQHISPCRTRREEFTMNDAWERDADKQPQRHTCSDTPASAGLTPQPHLIVYHIQALSAAAWETKEGDWLVSSERNRTIWLSLQQPRPASEHSDTEEERWSYLIVFCRWETLQRNPYGSLKSHRWKKIIEMHCGKKNNYVVAACKKWQMPPCCSSCSYCFTLFICGGPRHLSSSKLIFLWENVNSGKKKINTSEFVLLPHSYITFYISVTAFRLQNYVLTLKNNTAMFLGYFAIHIKHLDNLKYYLYMLGLGDILTYIK